MTDPIKVLDMIIEDCATDVKEFEGKPFTGKTVGELHGILEAKIEALANIMRTHLKECASHKETFEELAKGTPFDGLFKGNEVK